MDIPERAAKIMLLQKTKKDPEYSNLLNLVDVSISAIHYDSPLLKKGVNYGQFKENDYSSTSDLDYSSGFHSRSHR